MRSSQTDIWPEKVITIGPPPTLSGGVLIINLFTFAKLKR